MNFFQINSMKLKALFLSFIFLITFYHSYADNYPRNYAIDILHYAFKLTFSDNTDELKGSASITFQCKQKEVKQLGFHLQLFVLYQEEFLNIKAVRGVHRALFPCRY